MGACIHKVENLQPLLDTVDEQPVGLYVTLTATLVLPCQRVVVILGVQLFAIGQRPYCIVEFVHRKPAFLRTLVRPLVGV